MAIGKSDVLEAEIVEVPRLASDGYSIYLPGVSLISTTSGTHNVVIILPDEQDLTWLSGDHPVEPGDRVQIYGTSGGAADGYYTIATIVNTITFSIVEPINSSTGGFVNFMWPAGALGVGLDPTLLLGSGITAINVQDAFGQVVTPLTHETLRQLIHFIDEGPADGFMSGAYKVISPPGILLSTSVIWYVDNTMAKKIVEQDIIWTGIVPTTITWQVYNIDGVTIAHTVSDSITYENNIFETSRTRTII